MARIAGFSSEKDAKGNIRKVTFDFKKYASDLMPILIKIGAIEEDTFEKEWEEAFTVEEVRNELYRRIDERWDKKLKSQEESKTS